MKDFDLRRVKQLVDALESEDAFDRRAAIEHLAVLTQQRLDYRWSGDADERRRAIKRWRRWVAREERERRGKATIEIFADGKIDKAALDKALKGLEPAAKKALMQKVLANVVAQQVQTSTPVCSSCDLRPATVRITERDGKGAFHLRLVCEACATESDT